MVDSSEKSGYFCLLWKIILQGHFQNVDIFSWNPGGLIQLTLPEFSIVTAGFHRGEGIDFGRPRVCGIA